jgi:chemotaxis protein MotB
MSAWLPEPSAPPVRPIWMTTMVDLLALLVSFFVMLLSTSQIRFDDWNALVSGVRDRFPSTIQPIETPPEPSAPRRLAPRAVDLDYLHRLLAEKTVADPLLARSTLRRHEDRIVLSIPGDLLFAPDSVALSPEAAAAAAQLSGALQFVPNRVEVAGHTDPTPPSARGAYESNWELSLARSVAFGSALVAAGYGRQVDALGYGESRFDPELGYAAARRVELVIHAGRGEARAR